MTKIVKSLTAFWSGIFDNDPDEVENSCKGVEHSHAPDTILHTIGDSWRCWALRHEPDDAFARRLALHLQTLEIAITDDLERVLRIEKEIREGTDDHE